MFRVVGRDARGQTLEISVNVATEEDAKAIALRSGDIAVVDRVVAGPVPASTPPRTIGAGAATILGCVLIIGLAVVGATVGGLLGHEIDESQAELLRTRWLIGGAVGATAGVICGIGMLTAVLKRVWGRR